MSGEWHLHVILKVPFLPASLTGPGRAEESRLPGRIVASETAAEAFAKIFQLVSVGGVLCNVAEIVTTDRLPLWVDVSGAMFSP